MHRQWWPSSMHAASSGDPCLCMQQAVVALIYACTKQWWPSSMHAGGSCYWTLIGLAYSMCFPDAHPSVRALLLYPLPVLSIFLKYLVCMNGNSPQGVFGRSFGQNLHWKWYELVMVWGIYEALGMTPAASHKPCRRVRRSRSPSATGVCSELFGLLSKRNKKGSRFLSLRPPFSGIYRE